MQYQNPVVPGFYPDPSICRVGEDFYMVHSTFEYFPAVPIMHSKNLVNWEQIGFCVTQESYLGLTGCKNSGGIYAPTIRHHNGVFYMTTTDLSGIRNFYVTATNPAGPWSNPIMVDFPGIDPSFYFEGDKTYYMSTSRMVDGIQTTLIAEIDIKTGQCLTEKHELWGGTGGRYPEGPHIYKKDGWYYCLLAEGGTAMGHMVTMARSKNIYGPYQPAPCNPIYTHREAVATKIHGTGHMDLVADQNGNWWAVFLGYRIRENYFHHLGRETFLAPVTWPDDDFPRLCDGKLATLCMETDKLPAPVLPVSHSFTDDFSGDVLDHRYLFLRAQSRVPYQLNHGLLLKGNGTSLDTLGTPSLLTVRQCDFSFTYNAHFSTQFCDASRVGITAFYDNTRHFDLYYTKQSIEVYKCFDDIKVVVASVPYHSDAVVLSIRSDGLHYYFDYTNPATGESATIAQGYTRHLSSEAGIMSFTGVMLGLFVDNGTDTETKVHYLTYDGTDNTVDATT